MGYSNVDFSTIFNDCIFNRIVERKRDCCLYLYFSPRSKSKRACRLPGKRRSRRAWNNLNSTWPQPYEHNPRWFHHFPRYCTPFGRNERCDNSKATYIWITIELERFSISHFRRSSQNRIPLSSSSRSKFDPFWVFSLEIRRDRSSGKRRRSSRFLNRR